MSLISCGGIQRQTWCMGSYVGVDYNFTLCPLQGRLQHTYHGQPYAKVDLNPMPESTLSPSQGLRIWPLLSSPENWAQHKNLSSITILTRSIVEKCYLSINFYIIYLLWRGETRVESEDLKIPGEKFIKTGFFRLHQQTCPISVNLQQGTGSRD